MTMIETTISVQELTPADGEPRVNVILNRNGEEVFNRSARVFSEDDMIAVSNDIVRSTDHSQTDVDQYMSQQLQPIRIRLLREREQPVDVNPRTEVALEISHYIAVLPAANGEGPQEASIRNTVNNNVLSNFVLILDEEIEVQDDFESGKDFAGRLTISDRTLAFRIRARDYADGKKLWEAIMEVAGCEVIKYCSMDELTRAISTLSKQNGQIRRRKLTTNFGWSRGGKTYLSPSCRISASGVEVLDANADERVDLGAEMPACHLDLKKLDDAELLRMKRHIVEDLLKLHHPTVIHTLLGATAAAVLYPFAPGAGRFALWMVGQTGGGKSYLAKLFMNFFGDFPISSGRFSTWSATANFVQRQGFFFKDALYLVDDYKPEVISNQQIVRVMQTYADSTTRGRLKSDATSNVLRPIRGLLISTGEDVPEHNASSIARSVIVTVPPQAKILDRSCGFECRSYSGVMADFIHWLLAEGRTAKFTERFGDLQKRYYGDVAGQQNDMRIASNLAQLGAAFELFAEYLGDVWPNWQEVVRIFVEEDLIVIRSSMLGEAKGQQASEVFLRTLADLIQFNHVRIEGLMSQHNLEKPLIGRVNRGQDGLSPLLGQGQNRLEICTSLAMAQVNASLRQQGRPELHTSLKTLLTQLREDGKLLAPNGELLPSDDNPTRRVRLEGDRQQHVFTISRHELLAPDR